MGSAYKLFWSEIPSPELKTSERCIFYQNIEEPVFHQKMQNIVTEKDDWKAGYNCHYIEDQIVKHGFPGV